MKSERIVRYENIAFEEWMTSTGVITTDVNEKAVTFSYDNSPSFSGNFLFSTVASRTESLDLTWEYSWFHSWFNVNTDANFFVKRSGDVVQQITLVDFYQLSTVGPKIHSGIFQVSLNEGDEYGISIQASHSDSSMIIQGEFVLQQN